MYLMLNTLGQLTIYHFHHFIIFASIIQYLYLTVIIII